MAWDFTLPDRMWRPSRARSPTWAGRLRRADAVRSGGVDWQMLYVSLLYDPRKGHTVYLSDFDFRPRKRDNRHEPTPGVGRPPAATGFPLRACKGGRTIRVY